MYNTLIPRNCNLYGTLWNAQNDVGIGVPPELFLPL